MIYELTDTSVSMTDTFGNDLGFHPVYVIEADSPEEALRAWQEQHDRSTDGVTVNQIEERT